MTSEEAIEIVWCFERTFLDDLEGEYYDNLRAALGILIEDSNKLQDSQLE